MLEGFEKPAAGKPFDDTLSIPELEERVIEFWEKDTTFAKSLERTKDGKPFTFYDGPPFATGIPHYGHILASTIKDLIPRYQTMHGRFVRRRWGWDCHGLPIEEIVERKLGISGKKQIEEIGIQRFNETCRSMVLQFVDEWAKMVRRMGRWTEFENSYKTMDRTFMESVWWAFKQVYDKGLVYEGRKVLLYCPRCETPVSNFEVAMDNSYKDVSEESVYVKFRISTPPSVILSAGEEPSVSKGEGPSPRMKYGAQDDSNVYLLAWTTTPWTLPGNVALAVGAEIDYVKAKIGGETYVLAKELVAKVAPEGYEILSESKGKDLAGLAYEPLFDIPALRSERAFKVYTADFVTTEEGTGIVHTAVVYGEDDYQLGLREGLPIVPLLDEKGKFNMEAPELIRGQYFKHSEKAIKEDLEQRGLLLKRTMHTHSYPHCWRCGTALYYNAIPAWFINVQKIKPDLLRTNAGQINWFPGHLKHGRYEKSVEAAPDWNISRNRYWGNPIPVWKCGDCGRQKVAGSVADLGLAPTTFHFMRHGEAEQNVEDIISAYPEPGVYHLTEKGKEGARAAAEALKAKGVDLIFSSDLLRTRETAEIVAEATGVPVVTDPRLREFNVGIWNGKSEKDFDKSRPAAGWWKIAPEGGETWTGIRSRMVEIVNELTAKHPGKSIVIVSHGDPLWLVMEALGEDILVEPDYATPREVVTGLTDLHRPYIDEVILACECGGKMRRTPEIFDSWVEAGSMPFAEYHYPFQNKELFESRFPAQFVAEYIAQTRAWFYVMHVISQVIFDRAPFENVVTTGNILAEDGSKMSKSKNNFPDPWLTIGKYGVDSLRFYLMNSVVMQGDNVNFSEKDLGNVYRKVVMILWNVYQYYVTYLPAEALAKAGAPQEKSDESHFAKATRDSDPKHGFALDRWITARTKELVNEVTDHLDSYDTVHATRSMENFIDDLSTWYLRRSRGREDAGFYPAFRETLITVSKVIAPVMPHLAEAIYQNLESGIWNLEGGTKKVESVHLQSWPEKQALTEKEQELLKQMRTVREAASLGLAARKALNLPVRQPLAGVTIEMGTEDAKLDPELTRILCDELNVKKAGIFKMTGDVPIAKLDTELTPELKLEGLTRGLERFVQGMRKAQGFKVGEMAALRYETADAEIEQAFNLFDAKKTYISKIEKATAPAEALVQAGDFEGRAKIALVKV